MKKVVIKIEGMTCMGCCSGLERFLNNQEGINKAEVSLVLNNASIEYDESIVDIPKINDFVEKAGFKSLGIDTYELEKKNLKSKKINLLFTIVLGIIVMYLSMGHMIKLPKVSSINIEQNPKLFAVTLAVLSTIIIGLSMIVFSSIVILSKLHLS